MEELVLELKVLLFDKGYALGGDAFYGLGLNLLFPLPILPPQHIRGMFFLNSGSLVPLNRSTLYQNLSDLVTKPSIAGGVGLIARFAGFRMELNYCVPLRATFTDSLNTGFQFGIGAHFM